MKRLALLVTVFATMTVSAAPASAQGNYVPMDYDSLPQVPGCDWYDWPGRPGLYQAWCGSDEIGWYRPFDWYNVTGIWPPDYRLEGG
jgi:hypothetical protein